MKVHTYASRPGGFFVNSFILEGARCIVAVDAQFLVSEARLFRERVEAIGKPLAGLFLTHPHPDHFNGAAILLEGSRDVPIFATASTSQGIRETAESKRAYWTPSYGDDYPTEFVYPTQIVTHGQRVSIDDIDLIVDDLGAGEAADNVALSAPSTGELFASDLLYSGCHPWLAEGRSNQWLSQLESALARYRTATLVHAGHGPAGGPGLLAAQRDYIADFKEKVAFAMPRGFDPEKAPRLAQEWVATHRDWPLEMLVAPNIEAIARESD